MNFFCAALFAITLPEAPGKATTEKLCSACHGVNTFVNRRETKEAWAELVEDMLRRGMTGDDDEVSEITNYLATKLSKDTPSPRVNVNKTNARDLATGLGITETKARLIVKHRETNGNFKSIDDLLKVPGISMSAVESKRTRIDF